MPSLRAAPEVFFHKDDAPADAKVLLPLDLVLRQVMPPQPGRSAPAGHPGQYPVGFRQGRAVTGQWTAAPQPTQGSMVFPTAAHLRGGAGTRARNGEDTCLQREKACEPPRALNRLVTKPGRVQSRNLGRDAWLFRMPLSAVVAALPPEIRHSLNGSDPGTAFVRHPAGGIRGPDADGKGLVFKWGQLREWCSVSLEALVAPESEVELPLATLVPSLLGSQGNGEARKQVEMDTRIPDVFLRRKQTATG